MKKLTKNYKFKNSVFRKIVYQLLKLFMSLVVEYEVEHPGRAGYDGAVLFAANHVSNYDGIIMQMVIPRMLCFMSKAELFRNPLMGWVFNKIGSFPIKRGEFDRQAIINARGVLDSGLALMMFPEGTRTFGKGMIEARTGTAHLAMRAGCPVIPVALANVENIHKKGLRKTRVKIIFCEVIKPGEKETASELTSRLMETIAAHLPENLRGFYA